MLRWLIVLLLVPAIASASPLLRHDDPELVRPELRALTATMFEPRAGKLVETARQLRTYDAGGHLTRLEHRQPDGTLVAAQDDTWDPQGRLASRTSRDATGRTETRTFTYQVDAAGRITERILRDPTKPAGEYLRDQYVWAPDGSHTITTYRHYPAEGPYRSDVQVFDRQGRLERDCAEHGSCAMLEYDARGGISRIRQQTAEEHHYLVYETTYDAAGRITRQILGGTDTTYRWNSRGDVSEVTARAIAAQGGAITQQTVYRYTYR
jgi:YD repeat-containing protein